MQRDRGCYSVGQKKSWQPQLPKGGGGDRPIGRRGAKKKRMLFNRTELRRKSDIVSGAGDLYRGKEKEDIIIHQDRR